MFPAHYSLDYRDDQCAELGDIADACQMPRLFLCVAINAESGFRPGVCSARSSAAGLLQWMRGKDGKYLGKYTRDALVALGVSGQLPHVRARYLPHAGNLKRLADAYAVITAPAAVGINLKEPIYAKTGPTRFGPDTSAQYAANYPQWDLLDTGSHSLEGMALWARVSAEGPRFREMVLRVTGKESPWQDLSETSGLQSVLRKLGCETLKDFQDSRNLKVDGILGPRTKAHLVLSMGDF